MQSTIYNIIHTVVDEVKYSVFVGIGDIVRQMRTRLHQSQAQFAQFLQCSQNSISRYESGDSTPGLGTLLVLHDIGLPEERQIIDGCLKRGLSARGKYSSPNASIDVLRGLIKDSAIEEQFLAHVPPRLRENWEPLIEILARIVGTDRVLDESITEILRLWELHSGNYAMETWLRDVVGYLRIKIEGG
jgi:transcriptional regulator with XRE-family HTH domain